MVHNCVQATARIIMTRGMLKVGARYPVAKTVHDEFTIVVSEKEAQAARDFMHAAMVSPPPWMPDIPLESDVGFAKRYGDAK